MRKRNLALLLALALCIPLNAIAEEIEIPPVALDPGVVNNFNREILEELIEKEEEVQEEAEEKEAPEFESVKPVNFKINSTKVDENQELNLQSVVFEGNSIFKEADLLKYFQPIIGKRIKMYEAIEAVEEINKMFEETGYATSYAYIASQNPLNDSITVKIKEGKIGKITFEGNKYSHPYYLKTNFLAANKVQEGQIFNINNIDKSMEEMNSSEYIKGNVSIDKAEGSDEDNIKIKIKEKRPIKLGVMWDNDGNELVGQNRATMLLQKENLWGLGHDIYGGTVLARGTTGALAGYKMPVGNYGTQLQFDYSFTHLNLLDEYEADKISGNAQTFSTRIIQPLYNKKDWEIKTDLDFDLIYGNSRMYEVNEPIGNYRLTVLRHGISANKRDKNGIFINRLESSFGIPILGASDTVGSYFSNDTTDPQSAFYKLKLTFMRLQKLPKNCLGIARISAQYSPNNLYPSEQMNFGGLSSMRGYEPGEVLYDSGVNGTFEVRTPIPFFKRILPQKIKKLDDKVRLGFFYDWGVFADSNNGVKMTGDSNFLQSIGCGVHLKITKTLTASWEIGVPIGSSVHHGKDAVTYFAIKADLYDLLSPKSKKEEL